LGSDEVQTAKATLINADESDTNLQPIYFNATLADLPVNMATCGLIKLQIKKSELQPEKVEAAIGQYRFGPFKHGLKVDTPPAVMLGRALDPYRVSSIDPHTRAVDVNATVFSILLLGNFKADQIVWVRWWAVPAVQLPEVSKLDSAAVTFDKKTIQLEIDKEVIGIAKATVNDPNSKTKLNTKEPASLTLPQSTSNQTITAYETDVNTGIFKTKDIQIVKTGVRISASGSGATKHVSGAKPGSAIVEPEYGILVENKTIILSNLLRKGKLTVSYLASSGQTIETSVDLVGIEFIRDGAGKLRGVRIIDGAARGDLSAPKAVKIVVSLIQKGVPKPGPIVEATETEPGSGIFQIAAATRKVANANPVLSYGNANLSFDSVEEASIKVDYQAANGENITQTLAVNKIAM
jgi:hypothetical protein